MAGCKGGVREQRKRRHVRHMLLARGWKEGSATAALASHLCDALNVVTKDLAMALGSSLSESFSSLAAS
jgi:hypothetical protein